MGCSQSTLANAAAPTADAILTVGTKLPGVGKLIELISDARAKFEEVDRRLGLAAEVVQWTYEVLPAFEAIEDRLRIDGGDDPIDQMLRVALKRAADALVDLSSTARFILDGSTPKRYLKGTVFARKFDEAREKVQRATNQLGTALAVDTNQTTHRVEGKVDGLHEDVKKILEALRPAVANAAPGILLAVDRIGQGRPDEATKILDQAPAPVRESAEALFTRGSALVAKEKYAEAAIALQAAVRSNPSLAGAWYSLSTAQWKLGKYDAAAVSARQSVSLYESAGKTKSIEYANAVNRLGVVLNEQGHYKDAEHWLRRSLPLLEKAAGSGTPAVAMGLNNLAELLRVQGKYDEAKPLYERAIEIGEKTLGKDHPDVAVWLNNLALLLNAQGKYDEAKPLYERAIEIGEKVYGKDHQAVAIYLNNLALLLAAQGKYDEAKPLYERSLGIREKTLGKDHPAVATTLNNLAAVLESQGKYDEAKPLYERSLGIREKKLGRDHPAVATALNNLALLLESQGKYDEAKPLYERSLGIREKTLGKDHPAVAESLNNLALLLWRMGRLVEAIPYQERATVIRQRRGEVKELTEYQGELDGLRAGRPYPYGT